jgi:hypothetical protein
MPDAHAFHEVFAHPTTVQQRNVDVLLAGGQRIRRNT